jgi:uncharacterized protein RhaS with RHS repeats
MCQFTQSDPIGIGGGLNLYGYAGGDPINLSDPFGLCPPADDNFSDCATLSQGWWADRIARGEGNDVINTIGGIAATIWGGDDLPGVVTLSLPGFIGPSGGGGSLAKGIQAALKRAQGAEVSFSRLGRFTRAVWEVPGDKGAGYVRWNRILTEEGGTLRLFKDVYNQGGNFLRRDWYVGGPPR